MTNKFHCIFDVRYRLIGPLGAFLFEDHTLEDSASHVKDQAAIIDACVDKYRDVVWLAEIFRGVDFVGHFRLLIRQSRDLARLAIW